MDADEGRLRDENAPQLVMPRRTHAAGLSSNFRRATVVSHTATYDVTRQLTSNPNPNPPKPEPFPQIQVKTQSSLAQRVFLATHLNFNGLDVPRKVDMAKFDYEEDGKPRGRRFCGMSKPVFITAGVVTALAVIALAVGLGVGLSQRGGSDESDDNSTPDSSSPPITNSTTNATNGTFWTPSAGTSWQIVLLYPLNDTSTNVSVYDIDLFTNPDSTISNLHDMNRKVICYFSAGSYEDFRPDADQFNKSDYGKELDGWPGEYWLNTSSPNVRRIMQTRLDMAVQKGCDGVDPDNVDGYDNDNGIGLTQAGAADYVNWLAGQAHGRGLAVGLKNAGGLIGATLSAMQWQVNEQCDQYQECATFRPFIDAGKPVFHIEYPTVGGTPNVVSATKKASICGDADAQGFSTVLKNMLLDDWVETC